MNKTIDPAVDVSDATKLTLGGVEFLIPPLALRQVIRIAPHLPPVVDALNRRAAALQSVRIEDGKPVISEEAAMGLLREVTISESEADAMVRIIHAGVTRAHPHVTVDDIFDLPARVDEIISAVNVVVSVSHMTSAASEQPPGKA